MIRARYRVSKRTAKRLLQELLSAAIVSITISGFSPLGTPEAFRSPDERRSY
jgi:DNA-binding transcriptional regulator LsrR (DeoR family)